MSAREAKKYMKDLVEPLRKLVNIKSTETPIRANEYDTIANYISKIPNGKFEGFSLVNGELYFGSRSIIKLRRMGG